MSLLPKHAGTWPGSSYAWRLVKARASTLSEVITSLGEAKAVVTHMLRGDEDVARVLHEKHLQRLDRLYFKHV